MLSIIYNNKDSYDDFDLVMEKYPSLPCTKADYDVMDIEGRDGSLTVFKNYTDGEIKIDFEIKDSDFINNHRSIIAWINDETADKTLVLSDDVSQYYRVKQIVISDIKHENTLRKFTVTFKTDPFVYLVNGKVATTITNNSTITNEGTCISKPIFKIYGSGAATVTINSKSFNLSSIDGYVTIDSELNQVYRDNVNKGKTMTGEFPVFFVGQNNVSWTGNITKIESTYNWRCY